MLEALPAYQATNWYRGLDWRLAAATRIASGERPGRGIDPAVRALAASLLDRVNDPCLKDPAASPIAGGTVAAALRLHQGHPVVRAEVQARLLARESDAEVARRTGVPAEVVAAYESCFFCVRDRIGNRDWIVARAIGRPTPGDDGRTWRQVAYFAGTFALDLVLAVTRKSPLPAHLLAEGPNRASEERSLRTRVMLLVGLLRAESDGEFQQVLRLRRDAARAGLLGTAGEIAAGRNDAVAKFFDLVVKAGRPKSRKQPPAVATPAALPPVPKGVKKSAPVPSPAFRSF